MSDIKKAINTLMRSFERFNQEISKILERFDQESSKILERFDQESSKALSSLEKAAVPSSGQITLNERVDLKESVKQLFESQKSMKLTDIKKALRVNTLTELKPSVEELVKEGILRADEKTLGSGKKIIGRTILHLGSPMRT